MDPSGAKLTKFETESVNPIQQPINPLGEEPQYNIPPQKRSIPKPVIYTIFFLSIFLAVSGGVAAYFYFNNLGLKQAESSPAPTSNPIVIPNPTPSSTPDATADWLVYENTEYKFKVKCAQKCKIEETSPEDGVLANIFFEIPDEIKDDAVSWIFFIKIFDGKGFESIDEWFNSYAANRPKNKFDLVEDKQIDGYRSKEFEVDYIIDYPGEIVTAIMGDNGYIYYLQGLNYKGLDDNELKRFYSDEGIKEMYRYHELYEVFVRSFEFVDTSASNKSNETQCNSFGGKWLDDYSECEQINNAQCTQLDGEFNSCASACRHNPETDGCIEVCVPVCTLNKSDESTAKTLVTIKYVGGLCPGGTTCTSTKIIKNTSANQKLEELINSTNFTELKANKFTGLCPTTYDGQELFYTFYTSSGTQSFSSCEVEIDYNSELFIELQKAIDRN